jgi:uncharacterized protein YsxB (DUF464 family)
MTKVTIYKNEKEICVGFRTYGHAGYADEGEDIVCAAISILTINTMNAIEKYTDTTASLVADDEEGMIEFRIDNPSNETTLLLDTMILGLETLADDENYADFIDLTFEEV